MCKLISYTFSLMLHNTPLTNNDIIISGRLNPLREHNDDNGLIHKVKTHSHIVPAHDPVLRVTHGAHISHASVCVCVCVCVFVWQGEGVGVGGRSLVQWTHKS